MAKSPFALTFYHCAVQTTDDALALAREDLYRFHQNGIPPNKVADALQVDQPGRKDLEQVMDE
ncbi:MAG: hypothetical protein M1819_002506 [Sarea resinae]|nr:MAG: hypothetical protein M1819_002506 [Sarea resinae]